MIINTFLCANVAVALEVVADIYLKWSLGKVTGSLSGLSYHDRHDFLGVL